jgi:hypothetical protein
MAQNLKRIPGLYRLLILVVVILLTSTGIVFVLLNRSRTPGEGQTVPIQSGVQSPGSDIFGAAGQISPMSIRLSEGSAQELSAQPGAAQPVPVATGEPLTAAEIQQLLARLPAMTEQPGAAV